MSVERIGLVVEKEFARDLLIRRNNGERFTLDDEARIEAALEVALGAVDVTDPADVAAAKKEQGQ